MKRPIEADYHSFVGYARKLEEYATYLENLSVAKEKPTDLKEGAIPTFPVKPLYTKT